MELKQVLENKESLTKISNQLAGADPRTFSVKEGKIKRAKQDLSDMYDLYRQIVYQKSIVILSLGEQADSFNKIAVEDFGCYDVDGLGIFREIADKIDKVYYTEHVATSHLFQLVSDHFEDIASEIGIVSYPQLIFNKKYSKRLNSKEDMVDLIARAFFENIGAEVVGHYAITKASKRAFDDDFTGKVVPIVLSVKDDLAKDLLKSLESIGMRVFVVTSDKQADKEEVGKKLVSIKKKLK